MNTASAKAPSDTGIDHTVCFCRQIDQNRIQQAIDQGAKTLEAITRETGAGSECGSCQIYIKSQLGEQLWQAVSIASSQRYSENYCAFRLQKPDGSHWSREMPGAYFIFQAQIDGVWTGRPYAITADGAKNGLREITVKRKPGGFFSNWLFEHLDSLNQVPLRVSACMGGSIFSLADSRPIICLIGGIGITPVLALCRMQAHNPNHPPICIDYSASSEEDFFCRSELSAMADRTNLQINFRRTARDGRIQASDVAALVEHYPDQCFYICGPETYKASVAALLNACHVKPGQIIDLEASQRRASPQTATANTWASWGYRLVGVCLLLAWCLQETFGWKLMSLQQLQANENYKIFSGLLLGSYLLMQWRLPLARWLQADTAQLDRKRHNHRHFGTIAPLLFYLHATSVGSAYLLALSSVYLANSLLGYSSGEFVRQAYKKAYLYSWTILHVGLSTGLLLLSGYHSYIALAYK